MNTYRCFDSSCVLRKIGNSCRSLSHRQKVFLWVLQSFNTIQRQGYRAISCEMQRLVALPLGSTRAIQSKKNERFLLGKCAGGLLDQMRHRDCLKKCQDFLWTGRGNVLVGDSRECFDLFALFVLFGSRCFNTVCECICDI